MASIEIEEAEERARRQRELIADGRDPNEDIRQYQSAEVQSQNWHDRKHEELNPGGGSYDGPNNVPNPSTPPPSAPPPGNDRAARERQANDLLRSLGISDPGNIESFLSGRASWNEFMGDTMRRAAPTASGGGSGGDADKDNNGLIDPGFNRNAGGQWSFTGVGGGPIAPTSNTGSLEEWARRGITQAQIFDLSTGQLRPGWRRVANGYAFGSGVPPPAPPTTNIGNTQQPNFGNNGQRFNFNLPGGQFGNDPYTSLLEQIAQEQLNQLRNPPSNPGLDRLLSFLDSRFNELSGTPGYSPDEQALLRTQALEPIERDRMAGRQRIQERTAARGMLPSSGLHELDLQDFVDRPAEERRTIAQRDLAIGAIDRRDQDLAQAQMIAQLSGMQIPQMLQADDRARRGELLNTANLLYQLPRQSMFDALSVVNGSAAPPDLFSQAVQLLTAQQNTQALNDQRNAQFWASLGELFGNLF